MPKISAVLVIKMFSGICCAGQAFLPRVLNVEQHHTGFSHFFPALAILWRKFLPHSPQRIRPVKGDSVRTSGYTKFFDSAFQFLLCLLKNLPAYDRIVAVLYKILRQLPAVFNVFLADMV